MSSFLCNFAFAALNLALAVRAHQAQPSIETLRARAIYVIGTATYVVFVGIMVAVAETLWDRRDDATVAIVGLGLIAVLAIYRRDYGNPFVRGWLALAMKALPQVVLAWKILVVGGNGLSLVMVVMFHYLTLSRIFQVWLAIREAGWDRNRRAMALSEIGNEATWCLVTAAWLID
jgi:hypothetical protein